MAADKAAIPTRRLHLEPLRVAHAAALYEGLRSPELYCFTDDAPPPSLEWLEARYAQLERRISPDGRVLWLNWAVWSAEAACHVGYVQATVPQPGDEAEIAYVMLPAYWGKGYAREAVAAMMASLVETSGVARFAARTDASNARSIALLEALGFERGHEHDPRSNEIPWHRLADHRMPATDERERGSRV